MIRLDYVGVLFFRFIGNSPMNCNELVKVIFAINELQLYNID